MLRGEAGEGFLLRVARDFWLGLYSLYMLGISMGLFQACHVIDFQKKHNIKQPNVNKPELPLEIISKEMGQNNIVPTLGKERKSHTSSQHFVWRFARVYGHAWNRTLHHDAAP